MGEITLKDARSSHDLLTLIGSAIEQLQRGIELFETSSRREGAACLATVIQSIDAYLAHAEEDPLLQLARIDSSDLSDDLQHVKLDLAAVIHQVEDPRAN